MKVELQIWRNRIKGFNGSMLSTEREIVFHDNDENAKKYQEAKIKSVPLKTGKNTLVQVELLEQKTLHLPQNELGEKIVKAITAKKTITLPKMIHLVGNEIEQFVN